MRDPCLPALGGVVASAQYDGSIGCLWRSGWKSWLSGGNGNRRGDAWMGRGGFCWIGFLRIGGQGVAGFFFLLAGTGARAGFRAGAGMGTAVGAGTGEGTSGAGVGTLCSGTGGATIGLSTLCSGAWGCSGGAVARFRIWTIWMYALVTGKPKVNKGIGCTAWSWSRVSILVAVWRRYSSFLTFGKGT